jgi:predicted MFS family arabinose efflux permease
VDLHSINPWRGVRGMPADVWIIFATTLVNRAGTIVLPFLVLYLTQHLGYATGVAGFSLTMYGFGGLVSAPIAGWFTDRVGGLRAMQVSLFLAGVLLLILPLAREVFAVFTLIFLWAMVAEAVRPASHAAIVAATAPEHRKVAMALVRLAINLGMSMGPAVGGFLFASSVPFLFVIDGVTSVLAALVLTAIIWRRAPAVAPHVAPAVRAATIGVLRNRRMLAFLLGTLIAAAVFLQIEAAFPLFLVRDLGLPASFFGLTFVLNTVLIIFLEVPINLATAGWAYRTALGLGALLIAIGFGALIFASGRIGIAVTVVIWTFGEMIFFPVSTAYVGELAPADRLGTYVGAYWMVSGLAMMLGPWAGTLVMERFGAQTLWIVVGACGALAAVILWLVAVPQPMSTSDNAQALT